MTLQEFLSPTDTLITKNLCIQKKIATELKKQLDKLKQKGLKKQTVK